MGRKTWLGYQAGRAMYAGAKRASRSIARRNVKRQKTSHTTKQPRNVVTRYTDITQSKKPKRMSRKKKRWVKFVKKVNIASHYNDTLHTLTETAAGPLQVISGLGTAGEQIVVPLNGINSLAVPTSRNVVQIGCFGENSVLGLVSGLRKLLVEIQDHVPDAVSAGVAGQPLYPNFNSYEIFIQSCKLEIGIRNTQSIPMTCDIYECVSRADISEQNYLTATNAWSVLSKEAFDPATDPIVGTGLEFTQANVNTAGYTPYQTPDFGKYWKILKKTRVQLVQGTKANYTMWGYKGMCKAGHDLQDIPKGKVKDLIIVLNPTHNDEAGVAVEMATIEWTKTWNFKWPMGPSQLKSICASYAY